RRRGGFELRAEPDTVDRRQAVDAHVGMWDAIDHAWKDPAIAAQPGGTRGEVEVVPPGREPVPRRLVDGHVAHQGATDRRGAPPDERATHQAPAAVRADHDPCTVDARRRLHPHPLALAREAHDVRILTQLDPTVARRPGEPGIELVAADDLAEPIAGN